VIFSNLIYFIVALLVYTTYHPPESLHFPPEDTAFLLVGIFAIFAVFTRLQFRHLLVHLKRGANRTAIDHLFDGAVLRQSVLAIFVYAIEIYGLGLPAALAGKPVFSSAPTLLALLFVGLFTLHLVVVWAFAFDVHRCLYGVSISRKTYVVSNLLFAVPILLPWLLLSGFADIVAALPFEGPRQFLSSTAGEITYFLSFLVFAAVFAPVLIQRFWQCSPMENGHQRSLIERVCRTAGVHYRNILYWPIYGGRMITAGVMGLVGRFRYILVTEAMLDYLTPREIEAVMAHEIGHVKRHHLVFYLAFLVGYMLVSYATFDLIIFGILYTHPMWRHLATLGLDQESMTSLLFSSAIIVMFLVYFRFVFGYFMRNFERQADAYVYRLFDSATPLIDTLSKIAYTSGQSAEKPNWHHFSIAERIRFLRRCEGDRRWIDRHEKKMRNSIAVFVAGMLLVGIMGIQLNYGETGRRLNRHMFETLLERELEKHPGDPDLLASLGDIYLENGNLLEAERTYQMALERDSSSAHVLNNLSWLYATAEDSRFRKPERALALALRAVKVDPSPHVWDTLAESYFVNGEMENAVEAARTALDKATVNRAYFREQLQRFQNALHR